MKILTENLGKGNNTHQEPKKKGKETNSSSENFFSCRSVPVLLSLLSASSLSFSGAPSSEKGGGRKKERCWWGVGRSWEKISEAGKIEGVCSLKIRKMVDYGKKEIYIIFGQQQQQQ